MQSDRSEKHALLRGQSDQEDERPGDPVRIKERKRSVGNKRVCLPRRWVGPCSLALLLCVLQVLSAVFYIQTRWEVEDLQLQISTLKKKAECSYMNGRKPVDGVKEHGEQARLNLLTQQKLLTVESNIARVNQYVVSLKTNYEHLKNEVQGASKTQLSSLSDVIVHLNATAEAQIHSVRTELSHFKCVFANITRWICGLEEHLSSHMQNFTFPALELIEDEMCNFTAFGDNLESRFSKEKHLGLPLHPVDPTSTVFSSALTTQQGPEEEVAHPQELGTRMGLVHGYPNSPELNTTHAPLSRPHPQANNFSTDILLMKIKPKAAADENKYGEISAEGGNASEAVVSVREDGADKEPDRGGGNPRSMASSNQTAGFHELEMDLREIE